MKDKNDIVADAFRAAGATNVVLYTSGDPHIEVHAGRGRKIVAFPAGEDEQAQALRALFDFIAQNTGEGIALADLGDLGAHCRSFFAEAQWRKPENDGLRAELAAAGAETIEFKAEGGAAELTVEFDGEKTVVPWRAGDPLPAGAAKKLKGWLSGKAKRKAKKEAERLTAAGA